MSSPPPELRFSILGSKVTPVKEGAMSFTSPLGSARSLNQTQEQPHVVYNILGHKVEPIPVAAPVSYPAGGQYNEARQHIAPPQQASRGLYYDDNLKSSGNPRYLADSNKDKGGYGVIRVAPLFFRILGLFIGLALLALQVTSMAFGLMVIITLKSSSFQNTISIAMSLWPTTGPSSYSNFDIESGFLILFLVLELIASLYGFFSYVSLIFSSKLLQLKREMNGQHQIELASSEKNIFEVTCAIFGGTVLLRVLLYDCILQKLAYYHLYCWVDMFKMCLNAATSLYYTIAGIQTSVPICVSIDIVAQIKSATILCFFTIIFTIYFYVTMAHTPNAIYKTIYNAPSGVWSVAVFLVPTAAQFMVWEFQFYTSSQFGGFSLGSLQITSLVSYIFSASGTVLAMQGMGRTVGMFSSNKLCIMNKGQDHADTSWKEYFIIPRGLIGSLPTSIFYRSIFAFIPPSAMLGLNVCIRSSWALWPWFVMNYAFCIAFTIIGGLSICICCCVCHESRKKSSTGTRSITGGVADSVGMTAIIASYTAASETREEKKDGGGGGGGCGGGAGAGSDGGGGGGDGGGGGGGD